jgi:hypothetical protein
MNNKVEKQHFVPQFVLKNFSIPNKNQLWVFDKLSESSFLNSIRDTAASKNFYELEKENISLNTEEILSDIESDSAPILKKIIDESSIKNITEEEHNIICLFTALQYLRTNKTRDQLEQINQIISNKLKKENYYFDRNLIESTKSEIKDSSIYTLYSSSLDVMIDIKTKRFGLMIAPKSSTFLTSDNPITLYNHKPKPGRGNLGTRVKNIEIYFPISPSHSLVFTCPDLINELEEQLSKAKLFNQIGHKHNFNIEENNYIVDCYNYKIPFHLNNKNMDFQNSLQVVHSTRFIYSNENNFFLCKDMLKKDPTLKKAPKVQSN